MLTHFWYRQNLQPFDLFSRVMEQFCKSLIQGGSLDLAAILRKKTLHDEQEGEVAPLYTPEASSPQTAQSMTQI